MNTKTQTTEKQAEEQGVKSLDSTLEERGKTYGEFQHNADIAQKLKEVMAENMYSNWDTLPHYMKQSLQTTADKISRILTGDPMCVDNWHDIGGYAKLAENIILTGKSHPPKPEITRATPTTVTVIKYTTKEGGDWIHTNIKLSLAYLTLLCVDWSSIILLLGLGHVHSVILEDGRRWDCKNGFTK